VTKYLNFPLVYAFTLLPLSKEGYCHDIDVWMYAELTRGHILDRISTKLGMMDGCTIKMLTASGRRGLVITAVTVW